MPVAATEPAQNRRSEDSPMRRGLKSSISALTIAS